MKFNYIFILILFFTSMNFSQLKIGDTAPDFTLEDYEGTRYSLSDYQGSVVVVYFYPKASTPGCTKQACGIRDSFHSFEENNIKVFGISVDGKETIKNFVEEHSLNFPLLSDELNIISEMFGVFNPERGTAKRFTFIIDKEGIIADVIEVKDVSSHAEEVFEKALALSNNN